jgi:hypothetical protein
LMSLFGLHDCGLIILICLQIAEIFCLDPFHKLRAKRVRCIMRRTSGTEYLYPVGILRYSRKSKDSSLVIAFYCESCPWQESYPACVLVAKMHQALN